ncbi:MAG: DUF2330 domain-containing protein [Myxococcota bacterium]|nr:DUF2330 domain-containing protein [Myxococcota bacterium]
MRNAIAATTAVALTMSSVAAHAFCGFYVSGSDKKMFNDATNVVLMRSGTRTVLSMQNDYRGPLEDFAMVIPVPVVLKQNDVRVVPKAVFDRIDSLGSPRLVEYWEQDPCPMPVVATTLDRQYTRNMPMPAPRAPSMSRGASKSSDEGDAMGGADMRRQAVPPVLASFTVHPPTVTAGVATPMTWSYAYSNQPWPEPSCTVDHGVGRVQSGVPKDLVLDASTNFKLTCANSAGRSTKDVRVNVVKIEAKFDVAEYQILILSAAEAAGLDQWLKLNGYKIPADAEALLRPYVESGSKFFVAKVDPKKVQMIDGRAALSPLRFHYDSEEFSLPIRLGMANSSGKQDLIVNILSPDKRYEVANYKNVTIPTNFDVKPAVKTRFAEFYAALFDKTVEKHPGAVVTEYAWTSAVRPEGIYGVDCDPCPPEPPIDGDTMALGADVIGGPMVRGGYVLTRLHARYGKNDMKDDLRFKEGKPITGGREVWSRTGLEYNAQPGAQNFFQARYAIRYWWTGPIKCQNPQRGVWGGPPDGRMNQVVAASKVAFAPRGKMELAGVIKRDLWEIGYKKAPPAVKPAPPTSKKTMWFGGGALLGLMLIGIGARRRRKSV